MSQALISCIVPVYNGARYLRESLDSIAAQTYQALEIIVVDDGSTDNSAKVAAAFPAPIQLCSQSNAGPAAARNLGVRRAKGDFLAFLDADDLWHPEKLARQMACFQQHPNIGFCVTQIQNFWVAELKAEEEKLRNSKLSRPVPGYTAPTLVVRSDTFASVGEFDASMPHTSEPQWFLQAEEKGVRGELLSDVLVRRRLHTENRSRLKSAKSTDDYLRFIKARLDRKRQQKEERRDEEPSR